MTRSHPQGPLVELHPDLARLERENRRVARDRERREHLRRLGIEDIEEVIVEDFDQVDMAQQVVPPNGGGNRANARAIGAFDEPNARELQLGIIPPPLPINNFELKSSMLNLVERSTYKGHNEECPLEHLERFERLLTRGLKFNGVPEDTMKMILFPFSLDDKAAYWERHIPSSKVSTWADVKTEFLKQFFPVQKTARFRNEIQSFKQKGTETLSEAWERLKGFTRSCPHHGVTKENLLGIFYRGVHNEVRRSLDTASNGNFASLTCEQAETLIDNLAQSESCYGGDYDRSSIAVVGPNMSIEHFKSLEDKIDKLTRAMGSGQRTIAYVDDSNQVPSQENYQEACQEVYDMSNQEDCNYVTNYYNKPYNQSHPNLSYRSTNVENPQDQYYPPQQPRPQGTNFTPRPQGNNFPSQGSNQNRPSFPQQQGSFPSGNNFPQGGNFQGNFPQAQGSSSQDSETKAMLKTIMDGLARNTFSQVESQKETQRKLNEMQAKIDRLEAQHSQASSSSKQPMSFPSKPEPNPKAQCNMITLRSGKELHSSEDVGEEIVESREVSKDDDQEKVEVAKPKAKSFLDGISDEAKKVLFQPPPYEPPLPFPGRLKNEIMEKQLKRFNDILDTVKVTLPLKEAIDNSPTWSKFFKEMFTKKHKMERDIKIELERKKEALQIDHSPKLKTLPKKSQAGRFVIPCSLGSFKIKAALCDSGAFVNVISSDMVEEFGIKGMKPNSTSITFGDASTKFSTGMLEDYPLKVGNCIVPTDFIVLDMVGSKKRPLILGAPFLTTAGANIDYVKKMVTLKNVDTKVKYAIEPPDAFCGTIDKGEAVVKLKGPDDARDAPILVEPSFNIVPNLCDDSDLGMFGNLFEDSLELVDAPHERMVEKVLVVEKKPKGVVPVDKKTRSTKTKLAETSAGCHEPQHPPLTFKPLMIHDGKLECRVVRKGGSKPFDKVRILLPSDVKAKGMDAIPDYMVKIFNMKLDDRGPRLNGSLPTSRT